MGYISHTPLVAGQINDDRLFSRTQTGYVGAYRRLKAVFPITKLQSGVSVYLHGQLFRMIDQRVLTMLIHDKAFRQEVCDFMDAIVTTEIQRSSFEYV